MPYFVIVLHTLLYLLRQLWHQNFQISCGGGGVEGNPSTKGEAKIEAKSKWGYALIIISTLAVFHVAFGQVNGSYWL